MPSLLVVHHAPTDGVRTLLTAALQGATCEDISGVDVTAVDALAFARGEAGARTLAGADGYLLVTPANFGYMSGALKHVFDSTFLAIGGALDAAGQAASTGTRGRPYGLLVHGRYDTGGAVRSVESIVAALGWRAVAQPLEVLGDVTGSDRDAAYELGATCAAVLSP
ncbi:MAG: NAD(P)H-dependent oxidoreductase [Dermatophilaceae bacterium]